MVLFSAGWFLWGTPFVTPPEELLLHTLERGPLSVTIKEAGTLQSADNRDIICRVKTGRGTAPVYIKWLIENGSPVKKGDKLIELDDSAFRQEQIQQEITVALAEAAKEQAEQEYKIVTEQNKSDIKTAEVLIRVSSINLEKYCGMERGTISNMTLEEIERLKLEEIEPKEGEYRQLMDEINGRMRLAEAKVEQWLDRTGWVNRMVKRGFLSPSQAQSEQSQLESAQEELRKVQMEAEVLRKYTKPATIIDLRSQVAEAMRAYSRVQAQAKALEAKAKADLLTKVSVYEQERTKLNEINQQIEHCQIYAPENGMVVYYSSERSRWGDSDMIAQGEQVREGQKLLQLPNLNQMQVELQIHESMVMNLRADAYERRGLTSRIYKLTDILFGWPSPFHIGGIGYARPTPSQIEDAYRDQDLQQIADGQKAIIKVDAFKDRTYNGHVKQVATVANQNWFQPEVKLFKTIVAIDPKEVGKAKLSAVEMEGLRPGMSCGVTILVEEQKSNVLLLPIPAVVGGPEMGDQRKCLVMDGGRHEERLITIGDSNETMVEVLEGLKDGEVVILNPERVVGDDEATGFGLGNPMQNKGQGKSRGRGKGSPPRK